MRYTVVVRQHPPSHYIASALAIPGCKGRGRTRQEALQKLKFAIENWLIESEITTIDVNDSGSDLNKEQNPWLVTAGIFADDPMLEPMLRDIYAARDAESKS